MDAVSTAMRWHPAIKLFLLVQDGVTVRQEGGRCERGCWVSTQAS